MAVPGGLSAMQSQPGAGDLLEPYARVTKRLAALVTRLCGVLPIKQVAAFYDLHWSTVNAIDKAHLAKELGPPDFTGVELLPRRRVLHKGQPTRCSHIPLSLSCILISLPLPSSGWQHHRLLHTLGRSRRLVSSAQ